MPKINFVNEKLEVEVPEGANLRKEAMKAGVQVYNGINGFGAKLNQIFNCHGLGMCGTCRVEIAKGAENASKKGLFERIRLATHFGADIGKEGTIHLACKTKVNGDMDVVTRPELNLTGENFYS